MGHGHSHGYLFELGEKRLWRAGQAATAFKPRLWTYAVAPRP